MADNRNDEIELTKLLGSVWDRKWWIAAFTLLTTIIGTLYAILATPIYSANSAVQVESKSSGGALKDFAGIFEDQSSSATEVAILKSRMVLSNTVEQLNLTTQVQPQFSLPIIGKGIARLMGNVPNLVVDQFIPKTNIAELTLQVGEQPGNFILLSNNKPILEGVIGHKYETDELIFSASALNAPEGQRFNIRKISELDAVTSLQKEISVAETGKQTGIIEISLNGDNKEKIKRIVQNIAENYLLQNIARNSAEASKSLEFLTKQLPELKQRLTESENALNEYRQKNDSVDLNLEAKSALDTIVQLESDLNELTMKESEISQKFTRNHPAYTALIEKRKILNGEKDRLNKQVERLPSTQKEVIRLTRDLEVNQQIYIQLLNKIQELEIVKASAIGNVRILDKAQAFDEPVAPKKAIIVALSLLLGLILSSLFAITKALLHRGIQSTSEIDEIGLSTYATIPYSDTQESTKAHTSGHSALLSEISATDLSIEALRSLRTSLHFAMMEANNNLLMISGPAPSVGKSFISSNLANVLSKTGQKILLIDTDLRKSRLHHFLKLSKDNGVSTVISENLPFESAVQHYGSFDVILTGKRPPNPSELLSSARFQQLLEWASKQYDLVIVDTPPILAVTDAAIVGRYVGATLLVARFGETSIKELELSQKRFEQSGVPVKGVILNGMKRTASNRYEYYHYDYK